MIFQSNFLRTRANHLPAAERLYTAVHLRFDELEAALGGFLAQLRNESAVSGLAAGALARPAGGSRSFTHGLSGSKAASIASIKRSSEWQAGNEGAHILAESGEERRPLPARDTEAPRFVVRGHTEFAQVAEPLLTPGPSRATAAIGV